MSPKALLVFDTNILMDVLLRRHGAEAVLLVELARFKFLVTRDSDFDHPELVDELASLGFTIEKKPGRLYGELLQSSAQ